MSNLLLINKSINDFDIFVESTNYSTIPLLYYNGTSQKEILDFIENKFTILNRIGIVFSTPDKMFLDNKTFMDTQNFDFILYLIKTFKVTNIDYLGCETLLDPEWIGYYDNITKETEILAIYE